LTDIEKLTENKKVEDIGSFFSALFNRHPQTAREQIAKRGELFYSANKQEALLIKRDLQQVQRQLYEFGLKKQAKQLEVHLRRLNEKHFNEDL
jgi:hypothetical protein